MLAESQTGFTEQIVSEFLPRWKQNPPEDFARWGRTPTEENLKNELRRLAQQIFASAVSFYEPQVNVVYKNVAPENIENRAFLEPLKRNMLKRRAPPEFIASLFESGSAAPQNGAFLNR